MITAFKTSLRYWWQLPEPPTDNQLRMLVRVFAGGWMASARHRSDAAALNEGAKLTTPMGLPTWLPGPEWKWWQNDQ